MTGPGSEGGDFPNAPADADRDFPLHCSHWGTYRVETRGGKVTSLKPFSEDSDPSPIGAGVIGVLDHPLRITAPMFRKSWLDKGPGAEPDARGRGEFVQLTWDDAVELTAAELDRVTREHGNEAIFGGSYGWASAGRFHHAQSQLKRFLNCIGGFTDSVNSYSLAAAEVVMRHILGPFHKLLDETTSWPVIAEHTELFVAFGGTPLRNGQINAGGAMSYCQRGGITAAHKRGVRFVNVSPVRADMPEGVDAEWIAPLPEADTALMLGLAHTLVAENLHDQAFLNRFTAGSDRFLGYLNGTADGTAKSAGWAAQISRVPPDRIRSLARRMASSRTMVSVSWSLTRQDHGEQPIWAAVALAAMLGQLGLPGGGIGFGYGAVNSVGDHFTVVPAASFPQGLNPVRTFIPAARISDMLLSPGEEFDYDGNRYTYPDIRLIYWAGGNPFHHHQDLFRLKRAWTRPETVICHDWVWNSLARHSDIILPCTVSLEREDIAISRSRHLIHMEKAVEPPPGCHDDHEIFRGLAERMGVGEAFTGGRSPREWLRWMYETTRQRLAARGIDLPDFDGFCAVGWHEVPPPERPGALLGAFRSDPESHPLQTPSGRIEIFSAEVAGFGKRDCPGHAAWLEPSEWLGGRDNRYPLHLISSQPETKLHSQLDHGSVSMAAKIGGRAPVAIHEADAAARGISDGGVVRIFNDRGSCLAAARVVSGVMRGVVQMSTGAWFDPEYTEKFGPVCKHGNPNALTLDRGTSSLAQGPVAHTCLVEIEPLSVRAPEITARSPPRIVRRRPLASGRESGSPSAAPAADGAAKPAQ